MKTVSKAYRKKDAMQLVTGQPVYMDDLVPANCLIVSCSARPTPTRLSRPSIRRWPKRCRALRRFLPGKTSRRMLPGIPRQARRSRRPVPVTACSSTAMSVLWAMSLPLWPAKTKNAWTRPSDSSKWSTRCWTLFWITTRPKITPFWSIRRKTGRPSAGWSRQQTQPLCPW